MPDVALSRKRPFFPAGNYRRFRAPTPRASFAGSARCRGSAPPAQDRPWPASQGPPMPSLLLRLRSEIALFETAHRLLPFVWAKGVPMQDMKAHLEKLLVDAEDCALISRLATTAPGSGRSDVAWLAQRLFGLRKSAQHAGSPSRMRSPHRDACADLRPYVTMPSGGSRLDRLADLAVRIIDLDLEHRETTL